MREITAVALLMLSVPGFAQDYSSWRVNPRVLACSPQNLRHSSTLTLQLGPGHGRELAIRRGSDKAWFFLVVDSAPPEHKVLLSPEAFSAAKQLKVPASAKAKEWLSGKADEPIFSSSGAYGVYVSDNLESEAGGFMCTVRYSAHGP